MRVFCRNGRDVECDGRGSDPNDYHLTAPPLIEQPPEQPRQQQQEATCDTTATEALTPVEACCLLGSSPSTCAGDDPVAVNGPPARPSASGVEGERRGWPNGDRESLVVYNLMSGIPRYWGAPDSADAWQVGSLSPEGPPSVSGAIPGIKEAPPKTQEERERPAPDDTIRKGGILRTNWRGNTKPLVYFYYSFYLSVSCWLFH